MSAEWTFPKFCVICNCSLDNSSISCSFVSPDVKPALSNVDGNEDKKLFSSLCQCLDHDHDQEHENHNDNCDDDDFPSSELTESNYFCIVCKSTVERLILVNEQIESLQLELSRLKSRIITSVIISSNPKPKKRGKLNANVKLGKNRRHNYSTNNIRNDEDKSPRGIIQNCVCSSFSPTVKLARLKPTEVNLHLKKKRRIKNQVDQNKGKNCINSSLTNDDDLGNVSVNDNDNDNESDASYTVEDEDEKKPVKKPEVKPSMFKPSKTNTVVQAVSEGQFLYRGQFPFSQSENTFAYKCGMCFFITRNRMSMYGHLQGHEKSKDQQEATTVNANNTSCSSSLEQNQPIDNVKKRKDGKNPGIRTYDLGDDKFLTDGKWMFQRIPAENPSQTGNGDDDGNENPGCNSDRFYCDTCGKITNTKRKMCEHIRGVHAVPLHFICEICSKEFHSKNHFLNHQATHSDVKPFVCEICGVSYALRYYLNRHLKGHGNPYTCPRENCDRSFSNSTGLQYHLDNHDRDQTYMCNICGALLNKRKALEKHIRVVHNKVFHHFCPECGKGFYSPFNLRKHIGVHEKQRVKQQEKLEKKEEKPKKKVRQSKQAKKKAEDQLVLDNSAPVSIAIPVSVSVSVSGSVAEIPDIPDIPLPDINFN